MLFSSSASLTPFLSDIQEGGVFLVCFGIDNLLQFKEVPGVIDEIRKAKPNVPIAIVGCKADCAPKNRALTLKEGKVRVHLSFCASSFLLFLHAFSIFSLAMLIFIPQDLAQKYGLEYFECSAVSEKGVNEAFDWACKNVGKKQGGGKN
jgi:hypothetical protein